MSNAGPQTDFWEAIAGFWACSDVGLRFCVFLDTKTPIGAICHFGGQGEDTIDYHN